MTIYMLIGIPCSGKSTIAKTLMNDETKYICPDEIRKELYGDISVQGDPKEIFELVDTRILVALTDGYDVIYDATNTFKRADTISKFKDFGATNVVGIYVNTSVDICLERNKTRNDRSEPVPEDVILRMASNLEKYPPTIDDGFDELRVF